MLWLQKISGKGGRKMEKRRCVKTDEITVNMLVHALRDVFRKEKDEGFY